jgi:hypothetical protein
VSTNVWASRTIGAYCREYNSSKLTRSPTEIMIGRGVDDCTALMDTDTESRRPVPVPVAAQRMV